MHIFGRKKKEEEQELLLRQVQEKGRYDFFAALAKALLLFLLVYGALGGFLSAFELEYNKGLCMMVLFGLSLILAATYETGKRLYINLLTLGIFGVYLYMAFSNYWAINSGYYAIMNRIFKKAREYLDISGGVEYSMVVQDEYATVTLIVMFVGMVGVILFNIQIQNKCSLWKIMLFTFTPYVVAFYLECSPSLVYVIFLLAGYVAVMILQKGNVRQHLSGQMRYVLPLAVLFVMLIVRLAALVMPEKTYNRIVSQSTAKESTREDMAKIAQFGMGALFQNNSRGGGISGGALSKGASVMPSYETDLVVRFTPYSYNAVYLKAFTGKDYTGDSWSAAEETGSEDAKMINSIAGRKAAYEQNSEVQGKAVMEVLNVGADFNYKYYPYYTDYEQTEETLNRSTYTFYPAVSAFWTEGEADECYLQVPDSCKKAVATVCEEAGFGGSTEEIVNQIVSYFDENYSYTLRPGFYWGNPDYISHFLTESKRGYCAHFASACTMLFRYMGIPARYVEGYAFSYYNVVEDGQLVEDAVYEDYYDGYAPIGETALIELEVPDACAHAWVEIYVDGAGWMVIDPTPASTEEETTSFWDAFAGFATEGENPDIGEGDFGAYLEGALSGASVLLLVLAMGTLIVLFSIRFLRMKRERALSGRERVRLEYIRLRQCLTRKDREYAGLQTLAQQIDCMRKDYGLTITKEQEQLLYQIFFAEEADCDYEAFCRELVKMQRVLRRARKIKEQ